METKLSQQTLHNLSVGDQMARSKFWQAAGEVGAQMACLSQGLREKELFRDGAIHYDADTTLRIVAAGMIGRRV